MSIPDKPRPEHENGIDHRPDVIRTDTAGRFRIEGLVPGLNYRMIPRLALHQFDDDHPVNIQPTTPGENRDLGTITLDLPVEPE